MPNKNTQKNVDSGSKSRLQSLSDASSLNESWWHNTVLFILSTTLIGASLWNYILIKKGAMEPNGDVVHWFWPIARKVVNGQPLYAVPGTADMKPPGWMFLNVIAELTGNYLLSMHFLMGVCNAGIILFTYVLAKRVFKSRDLALLSSLVSFFLLANAINIFFTNNLWHGINNKSLVGVLFLIAILTRRSTIAGVALGGALLTNEYALAGLPVVAWLHLYTTTPGQSIDRGSLKKFSSSLLLTLAIPYVAIYAIWGGHYLENSIYFSYGTAFQYITASGTNMNGISFAKNRSILSDFQGWYHYTGIFLRTYRFPIIFAVIGAGAALTDRETSIWVPTLPRIVSLLTLCLSLSLFVRAYTHYWLMFIGPLAILSVLGFKTLVSEITIDTDG